MTDTTQPPEPTVYTIAQSADGSLNSYSLGCTFNGQRMNYAACQHRQTLLDKGDVKVPADWGGCRTAARAGNCVALDLRKEEVLAGKAIYFEPRSWLRAQAEKARRWVNPWEQTQNTPKAARPAPAPAPKPATDVFDGLGSNSYADAINAMARPGTNPPPPAPALRPVAPPNPPAAPARALPGESPLQMARRLAAERASLINP
jgi:hypothetical protein